MILHRDKARPAVHVGSVLHLGELPGKHARCADVAGFACLDNIVEGFHRFGDWGIGIEAMNLVEIDIVRAQAAQRCIDLLHDVFAR